MENEENLGQNNEFCAPLIWASNEQTCPDKYIKCLGCYIPLIQRSYKYEKKGGGHCINNTESLPIK